MTCGYPINSVENDIYIVLTLMKDFARSHLSGKKVLVNKIFIELIFTTGLQPHVYATHFTDAVLATEDEIPAIVPPTVKEYPATVTPTSLQFSVFVAEGDSHTS